MNVKL